MYSPEYVPDYNTAESALAAPFVCGVSDGMDAAWVHLAGELDVATAPELRTKLREAESRAWLVVLDLRSLAFMDAAGVHTIVEASIRARQANRRLLLLRGPANVDRVFSLTGSTDAVEIGELEPLEPVVRELQRSLVSRSLLKTGDRVRGHRPSR